MMPCISLVVVGVCVCLCVRLSVRLCEQVFLRAVSAVGTEREGMDRHHGRSVQQETGARWQQKGVFRRLAFPRVCIN